MRVRALPLLLLPALGACGQQASPDQTLAVATPAVWANIHHDILAPSCAFGSCHAGATPAAHLDLSSPAACANLVAHASCLFPSQTLVSPGAPDDSFLLAKLTGENLSPQPASTCGGATNLRMPFGAQPLPAAQIAAVRTWIAAGAPCDAATATPPAGPTPPAGAPPSRNVVAAAVDALTVEKTTVAAGARVAVTVVLSGPAGAGGATVRFDVSDHSVLGAPAAVLIPEGQTSVVATAIGKRPGDARLSANVEGDADAASLTITVTGLLLTELQVHDGDPSSWLKIGNVGDAPIDLGDYRLSVGDTTVALTGILTTGACTIISGLQANGGEAGDQAIAIKLTDDAAPATPIDSAVVTPADAPPGGSLVRRTLTRWAPQTTPTPTACVAPAADP